MNNQVAVIPPTPNGDKPEIVQFTEMWPGVTFTEVGLVFSDNVTRETFEKLGGWLGAFNQRSKLWIADWLMFAETSGYGHTYEDLMRITGLQKETLQNYASIGRAVPVQNRIAGPNMSLYAAVRSLDYGTQKTMLTKATEEHWDRDMLRAAVRELKKGHDPETVGATFPEDMHMAANLTPALGLSTESAIDPALLDDSDAQPFFDRILEVFEADDAPPASWAISTAPDAMNTVKGLLYNLRETDNLKDHERIRIVIIIDESEAGQ